MALYDFRCPACGRAFDAFAPWQRKVATCPDCGAAAEWRYSVPTTDIESFGRNFGVPRRPFWKMKVHRELDARKQRDASREAGAVRQFGAGRSTGS